MLIKTVNLSG